jgi:integrase
MSSIDKVKTGWRARWRTPDGASRSQTFERKVDAQRHLAGMDHSKLVGVYVDPSAGRETFKEFAERWRAVQVHRPKTVSQIETNLRLHVYPRIGHRPIGSIRQSEVQALVKAMGTKGDRAALKPKTVELIYTWVSVIFAAAQADRVIGQSPCRKIRLPEIPEQKVVPIRLEVVKALEAQIAHIYRALIVLGAGAGVRISEALGLTVDRVDWLRRTITIDRQLVGANGDVPIFGPVKDKNNRPRTIPMPDVVGRALSEHLREFGEGPERLIFTGTRGGPIRRTTFSDAWIAAAGPLGIPLGDGFHQLRHFYVSMLIHKNQSIKVVQERLGHRRAETTLDTYAHLWPTSEDETRAAVDEVLGAHVSPVCHDDAADQ